MQRKLPEQAQPPAILLPSLLFSGAACSGRDLLGLLLRMRKCCKAAPRVMWVNGYLDLGMLLENPSWLWIPGGPILGALGTTYAVPPPWWTQHHSWPAGSLGDEFNVLNPPPPPGEEKFSVLDSLGPDHWQWTTSQWLSPKSCRIFWGSVGDKGGTSSCTAAIV